jgi:ABC-type dipeptide/oligopeptide/nickel transport system permease component
MVVYALKRLFQAVPALLVISIIVFLLMHLAPGDPVYLITGPRASAEVYESTRQRLGLDEPLTVQYGKFINRILVGDFGRSLLYRAPVSRLLAERVGNTLLLGLSSMLVSYAIGIPAGVLAAVKRGTWTDLTVMSLATIGMGIPSFWLGLVFISVFAVSLSVFPASGYDQGVRSLVLPALTLGIVEGAVLARLTRSSVLETLRADYVRTARAKGLPPRVVLWRHAFRNALLPIISFLGLQLGFLLSGAVVVETVYGWPGVGRLLVDSIVNRDFPVAQGVLLIAGFAIIIGNLFADLLYGLVDPRIER